MNFVFEWQEQYLTREIVFLPQEHKIHIFELTCNEDRQRLSRKTQRCFDLTPTNLSTI